MRILLVSQMYPGPDAPDLGTFVAQVERELAARGNEIELAVLDTRAGGKLRYLTLARRARAASRPDVVYAHFLVPSGLIAALAGGAPLVVTAHGRDVRNIGAILKAAGTSLDRIVSATVIVLEESDFAGMNEEWLKWFPADPPARQGAKLPVRIPGMKVSIAVIAEA